jgi:hypothetical protein
VGMCGGEQEGHKERGKKNLRNAFV